LRAANVHNVRLSMPRQSAPFVHAIWAALVLAVAIPAFAQQKSPPLIGATRDQVVARLGDPKSNLKAGAREVLFYSHLKLTLRNGLVIDSEELADEPVKRTPEPAPTTAAATPSAAGANAAAPTPSTNATEGGASSSAKPTTDASANPPKPTPPPEPELEIKSIKSGSSSTRSGARPTTKATTAPAIVAQPPAAKTAPVTPGETTISSSSATPVPVPSTSAKADASVATVPNRPVASPDAARPVVAEEAPAADATPEKPTVDPKKKAAVRQRWRLRRDAETEEDSVQLFSTQSYVIAAITMLAGIGYLWWRSTQRNLALAASAVSRAPFETVVAADTAGQFTSDLIGKLGTKRFERLVASYYAKTGVVAERTNAGAESPVQIKIFWKGEPKPFAGVQCHANPPTLIGSKPLQDLFTALSAAEIRRGYVVTTGKFNVEARDFAEEKHFTLLSGDLFLEKLNALPPAARAELLRETATEEPATSSTSVPAV
jgi:hypothetical protein